MEFPRCRPVICSAFLVVVIFAGCARNSPATAGGRPAGPPKQAVEVIEIQRRDLADTLTLVGSLAANESAALRPEISGQIRAVLFEEGQHVAKGQVLARIDDAELRAQVAQAEARFHLTELNLKRSENLTEARSMSQAEADRTKSEFAAAQAEVSLLRVRLDKMEIKAPFDGVTGARSVSPGDYVTAQTILTTLNDLSRMKIDFQVPERFAGKVKPGTTFTIRSSSLSVGETVKGEVYFSSSVIDRNTRSTQVKGYLTTAAPVLKPGMFANIDLVLEVRQGVLTVPEGSVLTTAAGASIIAVKAGAEGAVAEFVPVRLGLRSRGFVEVQPLRHELAEKQQIVASGVGGLNIFPGTKLEPRPLKAEFRVAE